MDKILENGEFFPGLRALHQSRDNDSGRTDEVFGKQVKNGLMAGFRLSEECDPDGRVDKDLTRDGHRHVAILRLRGRIPSHRPYS